MLTSCARATRKPKRYQVKRVDIRFIKNILTCQKGRETKSCKFLELLPTPYFLRKKENIKKCTYNTAHRTFENRTLGDAPGVQKLRETPKRVLSKLGIFLLYPQSV